MSNINFEGCQTIGDVYRRADNGRLLGSLSLNFVQFYNIHGRTGIASNTTTPILNASESNGIVTIETVDAKDRRLALPFSSLHGVITSIVEYGDVYWPSPGQTYDESQYTIVLPEGVPDFYDPALYAVRTLEDAIF